MRIDRARTLLRTLLALALAALLLPAKSSAQTVLRYTDHEPLGGMRTRFIKDVFLAAVEKESSGRLKVEDHWDGALAKSYDALRAVGAGRVAEIGVVVPEYTADALPLQQLFKSFLVGPIGDRQVQFFRRAYAEVPALAEELRRQNVVPLFLATGYPVAFFSADPLDNLEGLRGKRWRTASFWHRDFVQNAGARPVTMPWGPGIFDALKARTLDGLVVNVDSGQMLRVHEPAPHVLASKELWLGHVYVVAMNADAWDRLAEGDKDAVRRAAETAYRGLGQVMDRSFDAMMKDLGAEGAKARVLERGEVEAFEAAVKVRDVQAAWVRAQDAKGVKGVGRTLDQVRAILAESMR